MCILLILFLLSSNAVLKKREKSILYVAIVITIVINCFFLCINSYSTDLHCQESYIISGFFLLEFLSLLVFTLLYILSKVSKQVVISLLVSLFLALLSFTYRYPSSYVLDQLGYGYLGYLVSALLIVLISNIRLEIQSKNLTFNFTKHWIPLFFLLVVAILNYTGFIPSIYGVWFSCLGSVFAGYSFYLSSEIKEILTFKALKQVWSSSDLNSLSSLGKIKFILTNLFESLLGGKIFTYMGGYTEYKEPTKKTGKFGFLCFFSDRSYIVGGKNLLSSNDSAASRYTLTDTNPLNPSNSSTSGTQASSNVQVSLIPVATPTNTNIPKDAVASLVGNSSGSSVEPNLPAHIYTLAGRTVIAEYPQGKKYQGAVGFEVTKDETGFEFIGCNRVSGSHQIGSSGSISYRENRTLDKFTVTDPQNQITRGWCTDGTSSNQPAARNLADLLLAAKNSGQYTFSSKMFNTQLEEKFLQDAMNVDTISQKRITHTIVTILRISK